MRNCDFKIGAVLNDYIALELWIELMERRYEVKFLFLPHLSIPMSD